MRHGWPCLSKALVMKAGIVTNMTMLAGEKIFWKETSVSSDREDSGRHGIKLSTNPLLEEGEGCGKEGFAFGKRFHTF